jgi:RNA-binding protein 26
LVAGPSNLSNPRKRGLDNPPDEHEYRKGPRLSNDPGYPGRGRGGRGQRGGRGGGRDGYEEPSGEYGGSRPQQYRPPDQPKRGMCRDYHSEWLFLGSYAYIHPRLDHGYCSRGAYCKYSHGDDAVVPSQLMGIGNIPQAMLPFMSMMNNAMFPGMNGMDAGNAYDPNERMDMQRTPMMRRQDVPVPASGELPVIQDLTPWTPLEEPVSQQNPDLQQPGQVNMAVDPTPSQDQVPPGQLGHHPYGQGQGSRGRRGRGGPRTNGTFPPHVAPPDPFNTPASDSQSQHPLRPDRRQDKTLVVEKIPEDHLSLGAVNDWFKKFGTVTNVAVDPPTAKALVTFAEHDQAWKAWKSEEAVFGNRFVKVFWHRPLEGRGGRGMKALEVSATLIGKLQGSEDQTTPQPAASRDTGPVALSSTTSAPPKKPTKPTANALQELTAKQERLQQMIAEQKALMSQLGTANAEEKKDIMAKLRKLGEDMKAPAPAPAQPAEKQEDVEMGKTDHEASKKDGGDGNVGEENTEELQAKLAKLKAEVIVVILSVLGFY